MINIAPPILPTPPGDQGISPAASANKGSSSTFNEVLTQTVTTQQQNSVAQQSNESDTEQTTETGAEELLSSEHTSENTPTEPNQETVQILAQETTAHTDASFNEELLLVNETKDNALVTQHIKNGIPETLSRNEHATFPREPLSENILTNKIIPSPTLAENNITPPAATSPQQTIMPGQHPLSATVDTIPQQQNVQGQQAPAGSFETALNISQNKTSQQIELSQTKTESDNTATSLRASLHGKTGEATNPVTSLPETMSDAANNPPHITRTQHSPTASLPAHDMVVSQSLREKTSSLKDTKIQTATTQAPGQENLESEISIAQNAITAKQHISGTGSAFSPNLDAGTGNDTAFLQTGSQLTATLGSNNGESPVTQATTFPGSMIRSETLLHQISEHFTVHTKNQETQLHIQLQPAELGELKIDLTYREGAIRANVFAQSQHVQEVLEKNMPRLRELLEGQGLTIEEIHVGNTADVLGDFNLFQEQLTKDNHSQHNASPIFTGQKTEDAEQFTPTISPGEQGVNITV